MARSHTRTAGEIPAAGLLISLSAGVLANHRDDATLKEIPVGGFASAPPQMRHYAQCKGDGVVQVNGIAPFVVNFVGPDDPGPAKKMN